MAIKIVDEYVNSTPADADYPGGSFKNATSGAGVDGTPLEKKWANDWLGFFQALLAATGIVPSGVPDTAVTSDYLTALWQLIRTQATATVRGAVELATAAEVNAQTDTTRVVTPATLAGYTPRVVAWGKVNADGTFAFGYGATSSRSAKGKYYITFSVAEPDTDYGPQLTAFGTNFPCIFIDSANMPTVNGFNLERRAADNTVQDSDFIFSVLR